MNKFSVIEFIKFVILKLKSLFKKDNKAKKSEENIVQENKIISGISDTIFRDKMLKANEKFYLMVLINSYNNKLGYAEIKSAVNSKNNNITINIINRLEEKGYIKNIELKKGLKGRYVVLKHINLKDDININENSIYLEKQSHEIIKKNKCKDINNENIQQEKNDENIKTFYRVNNDIKSNTDTFENKTVFEPNLITINLIKRVQQELKTNYNLLKFIVDKNSILSNEIKNYLDNK